MGLGKISQLCLVILFTVASLCSAAEEPKTKNALITATAAVDREVIYIGDKITYTITVKAKKNIEVELPRVLSQGLSGFAIKDFATAQKAFFGKKTFKQWYLLGTYISGQHTLPAAVIKYRAKGQSNWQELSLKEVKIEVKSVLDNASNQADIRDIRGPKSFASKIWPYVLIILAVFLIVGIVFSFIFWKKNKVEPKAPPLLAHIIAYAALAELEKKEYIRKGQTKVYYIELSDIVRRYLENRFNIRAPQMSTEEFLIKVKEDSSLSVEHKGLLRDFLTCCDLVKFAKYQPAETEAGLSLASARKLIEQTKTQSA